MALFNQPYCDTNMALFPSHTLSRHIYAKSITIMLGECICDAQVIN